MIQQFGTVDTGSMMDAWKRGGRSDFWKLKPGDSLIYICPPCRPEDKLAFYPIRVHYQVGPKENMAVCLDLERNKVLTHPSIKPYLAGLEIEGGCPVCQRLDAGTVSEDCKGVMRYLWNIIPIAFREDAKAAWQQITPIEVKPLFEGYTIWDGLLEVFANEGNITNPDQAIFARVSRKGTTRYTTKYGVQIDSATVRKPRQIEPAVRQIIGEALAEGGSGDAYQMAAKMVYSRGRVEAMLTGVEVAEKDEYGEQSEQQPGQQQGISLMGDAGGDAEGDEDIPFSAEPTFGTPPEEVSAKPVQVSKDMGEVQVQKCEVGETYLIGGKHLADFVGVAKGIGIFSTAEDKIIRLKADANVQQVSIEGGEEKGGGEPASNDDEPAEVKHLREQLAKRRQKK